MAIDPPRDAAFPAWLAQSLSSFNFGAAALRVDISTLDDEFGNPNALARIACSLSVKGPLARFSHLARKAAAPLAGLSNSLIPELALSRIGLSDQQAAGHAVVCPRSGLAARLRHVEPFLAELCRRSRLGSVDARFEGSPMPLSEALALATQGPRCRRLGSIDFAGAPLLLPMHWSGPEAPGPSSAARLAGAAHSEIERAFCAAAPGRYEAFATVDADGQMADFLLLRADGPMPALANSLRGWSLLGSSSDPSGLFSSSLTLSDSAKPIDHEARRSDVGYFMLMAQRAAPPNRFARLGNSVLLLGPPDEEAVFLEARAPDGSLLGLRAQFGHPEPSLLELPAQAAAQAHAEEIRSGTPRAPLSARAPKSRL